MRNQWWEPGKSFVGGKCTFFGANSGAGGRRRSAGSILQFFNRLFFNRGKDDD